MAAVIDTSVIIDVLRGVDEARELLRAEVRTGVHASEITRVEVLAGMRRSEEAATRALLGVFRWHAVDEDVAESAGELGRVWLPSHRGIGAADLAIAATAQRLGLPLHTLNVKHFPMFAGIAAPY